MTEEEKAKTLQTMTGESNTDVLSVYLHLAKNAILERAYPYKTVDTVPEKYEMLQIEIASYLINKRGAEGETSHSENGVSRSYESGDIPASLLRRIVPMAGVMISNETDAEKS